MIAQAGASNSEAELADKRGMHHFDRCNYQREKGESTGPGHLPASARARTEMADPAAGIAWLDGLDRGGHDDRAALPPCGTERTTRWRWTTNSRAWTIKILAGLVPTPSRPRDALAAALRAASYRPRDPFTIDTDASHSRALSSSLASRVCRRRRSEKPSTCMRRLKCLSCSLYLNHPPKTLAYAEKCVHIEADMPVALIRRSARPD